MDEIHIAQHLAKRPLAAVTRVATGGTAPTPAVVLRRLTPDISYRPWRDCRDKAVGDGQAICPQA